MSNPIYTAYSGVFTRPADTTAYAANDVVGTNLAVTGATNASPIVVTTAAHGFSTGDVVTIASVGGNTAANGTFRVTVVSSTTFSLQGSVGNGTYTSGGTVAKWNRVQKAARDGGAGRIRGWRLTTNSTNVTASSFSLAIFKASTTTNLPPAATLDNVGNGTNFYTNYREFIHKTASATVAATTVGTSSGWCGAFGLDIPFDLDSTSQDLWVQVIAEAGYTPASAQTFVLSLDIEKL
jgi:hypothetical protein